MSTKEPSKFRQPTKIEFYVTRVASQSDMSITNTLSAGAEDPSLLSTPFGSLTCSEHFSRPNGRNAQSGQNV